MKQETVDPQDDPFERAVRREGMLRRLGRTQRDAMRVVKMWFGALLAAWGLVLAGHWLVFPEPRWLVVLHTVVFAVYATFTLVAMVAHSYLLRRVSPGGFDD